MLSKKIKLTGVLKEFFGDRDDLSVFNDAGDFYGPIATQAQYDNYETSEGYLYSDGYVRCNGEIIGTVADVELA